MDCWALAGVVLFVIIILLIGTTSLHCSVDNLELFSCIVSNEDDTALSILDPVSIGVELKSLEGLDMKGTHLLEVWLLLQYDLV